MGCSVKSGKIYIYGVTDASSSGLSDGDIAMIVVLSVFGFIIFAVVIVYAIFPFLGQQGVPLITAGQKSSSDETQKVAV